jgi:molybdopterin converting factor subunit 1
MIVKVMFFASARDLMGCDSIEMSLDDCATLGQVKQSIIEQHPVMSELVGRSTFSVDRQYARDEQPLYHGAEIGLIPPVSGG